MYSMRNMRASIAIGTVQNLPVHKIRECRADLYFDIGTVSSTFARVETRLRRWETNDDISDCVCHDLSGAPTGELSTETPGACPGNMTRIPTEASVGKCVCPAGYEKSGPRNCGVSRGQVQAGAQHTILRHGR